MEFIPFKEPTTIFGGKTYTFCQQERHILRQRRLELNMTQAQVAKKAGILLRQYARIEGQEGTFRSSSARILLSVCAVLKLDPYMFFPEIKDNSGPDHTSPQTTVSRANTAPVEIITIPAKPSRYIPLEEYMDLMQRVPAGKVVTVKTVQEYFKKKYSVDVIVIETSGRFVAECTMSFPFWRELSANGQLYATTRFKSRDQQQRLLEEDGLEVIPCGANQASLKVKDYKKHLFDLNSI